MRHRFSFILLVIFGSFCVYCAQNIAGGGNGNGNGGNGGGGMVGSAGADTCCTPPDPPPGTILFDQKFMTTQVGSSCYSPAIDVAGNRTVVVHGPYIDQYASPISHVYVQWTFGGQAGWVGQVITTNDTVVVLDGRLGKQFRVGFAASCTNTGVCTCTQDQMALTVVGYKQ